MKTKRRRRWVAILAVAIAVIMVLGLSISMVRGEEEPADGQEVSSSEQSGEETLTVPEALVPVAAGTSIAKQGIYINSIDVTGMNRADAERAVSAYMDELRQEKIELYAGERSVTITAGDLGLDHSNKRVVEEALSIGKKGNVLKRFLAEKQIREKGPIVLDLQLTVDRKKVENVLKNKKAELDCDPKPNGLEMNDDDTFTITPAQDGVKVDQNASADAVVSYVEKNWFGGQGGIELNAELTPGKDTSEELRSVRNLLGYAETTFDTTDEGRSINIALAAEHINGTVLYPGEEFSAVHAIGPTTAAEGFQLGASYASDRIVDSYGGGVCQVTSTLYGAVLEAELEVVERHNHTMRVHYVLPAFDATISDNDVDFRFVNSTEAPVYIASHVADGVVSFSIYGKETRDPNRTIEYESREISKKEYTTKYKVAEDLPFGQIQEVYGEDGVQAELWKNIYIDGEFDSEEKINSSNYTPLNHTYFVGAAGATEATRNSLYNAVDAKSLTIINSAIGNGSTVETVEVQED